MPQAPTNQLQSSHLFNPHISFTLTFLRPSHLSQPSHLFNHHISSTPKSLQSSHPESRQLQALHLSPFHPPLSTLHSPPSTLHPPPSILRPKKDSAGAGAASDSRKTCISAGDIGIYRQTARVSAAHTRHCATNCNPCRPLIRAFSGWIRTQPPYVMSATQPAHMPVHCATNHTTSARALSGWIRSPPLPPAPTNRQQVRINQLQGYLPHKKPLPPRTLHKDHA